MKLIIMIFAAQIISSTSKITCLSFSVVGNKSSDTEKRTRLNRASLALSAVGVVLGIIIIVVVVVMQ